MRGGQHLDQLEAGFQTVVFEKQGSIGRVTLNRPQVLNVYNVRMRDELFEVFSAVQSDDEIRVLLLGGAGRAFCAGADLTEFGTAPSPTIARQVRFGRDVWAALDGLHIPTIAAMHGFAFGSGLELALFCDLRIAAHGTQFAFPEVKLGFIPAAGGTQTLPRAIGLARALDLLLTGRRMETDEALGCGLITRVVPADQLDQTALELAHDLANLEPRVARAAKQAIKGGADMALAAALQWEAQLAAGLRHAGA